MLVGELNEEVLGIDSVLVRPPLPSVIAFPVMSYPGPGLPELEVGVAMLSEAGVSPRMLLLLW
jgi:hypothetical protein